MSHLRNPLVSVVLVTCYRPISVFLRSLEGALTQTYENLQIVVVDVNKSKEISNSISENINSFSNDKIRIINAPGLSNNKARNAGFSISNGEYVAFLDDDDEWATDKLEKQLGAFDDDTFLVYSNYMVSDQQGNKNPFFKETPDTDNLKTRILGENIIGCTSMPLIRRQAFIDVGGFNESFKANQEWDLWIRIIQNHKVKYSPVIAGIKHYSSNSISNKRLRRVAGWTSLFIHHASKYHNNRIQFRKALGFFIKDMFDKRMYFIGTSALPLYIMLKIKEEKE